MPWYEFCMLTGRRSLSLSGDIVRCAASMAASISAFMSWVLVGESGSGTTRACGGKGGGLDGAWSMVLVAAWRASMLAFRRMPGVCS